MGGLNRGGGRSKQEKVTRWEHGLIRQLKHVSEGFLVLQARSSPPRSGSSAVTIHRPNFFFIFFLFFLFFLRDIKIVKTKIIKTLII